MSFFARMKLFQKAAIAILAFYMGMMILVTIVAHARQTGAIGMDIMKMQQARQEKMKKAETAIP